MNNAMLIASRLHTSTSIITALSILPHIFCCGIPAIIGLIALGTTVGLAASLVGNPFYQFVDAYHTELLIIAIASVVLSGIMNLIAYRIECREAAKQAAIHGHCQHADCAPKKRTSLKIFALSVGLLCLDLAWFFTEEHVLGLHHHGHEAEVSAPSTAPSTAAATAVATMAANTAAPQAAAEPADDHGHADHDHHGH